MSKKAGKSLIIEQFLADGMDHMFGNPGTVEQGFLDELRDYPKMKYILTLQESVAVLMADGYARATHRPTLVQLHSSPGIGNAVGALYQAKRGHAPLVVIGGDSGVKYLNMDAQMAGDLVGMMEPVTKYSTVVTHPRSILRTLRRAVKIAGTPPMGPVYVCLPMDVLDEISEEEVFPAFIPSTRVVPSKEMLDSAAKWLLQAKKPMMFIGDGVAYSGANEEVTKVAELLGAEVFAVDSGDVNFDETHPLYQGTTGHMFGSYSLPITSKGDVNLVVGTYMVPEVFPELGNIFAPDAKVIHFDLNSYEIAKNHRVDLGAVCDPKLTMAALAEAILEKMSTEQKNSAKARNEEIGATKANRVKANLETDQKNKGSLPLHMAEFAEELSKRAPKDVMIFDEALTSGPEMNRYFTPKTPGSYFVTRGGSLGVGIPGAIGIKLAHPDKTVIGFTGDGGSMYTIQALWSAAHHRVGAKFVVCSNRSYNLLNLNVTQYWKERNIVGHELPKPFSLTDPFFDFTSISTGFGVPAMKVEKTEEIGPAIEKMLATDGPFLIDLIVTSQ